MNELFKCFIILLTIHSVSTPAAIPIIGLDDDGNEQINSISEKEYTKIISLQAGVAGAAAEDQLLTVMDLSTLSLHGILVGLGAQGNVGIGPFQVGTGVNQQFYFEIQK